jgi:hypothetical protein
MNTTYIVKNVTPPCYAATTKTHGWWHGKNDESDVRRESVGGKKSRSNGVHGPVKSYRDNTPIENSRTSHADTVIECSGKHEMV